jgi:hypothetical protein
MEGTRVSMEAKEVCVKHISTKFYEIHFQYNFLELGMEQTLK